MSQAEGTRGRTRLAIAARNESGADPIIARSLIGFATELDDILRLMSMMRVRFSLFAFRFDGANPVLASRAATAACGGTGLLGAIGPHSFVMVDVGPRPAGSQGDAFISERVRQRIEEVLSAAGAGGTGGCRITELHMWTGECQDADELLHSLDGHQPRLADRLDTGMPRGVGVRLPPPYVLANRERLRVVGLG